MIYNIELSLNKAVDISKMKDTFFKKENEKIDFISRIKNLHGKQILLNNQYRYIEGIEIIKNLEDI